MSVLRLYVRTDNAAFADDDLRPELARILRHVAEQIEDGRPIDHYTTIFDVNGNDVGRFAIKPDEEVY